MKKKLFTSLACIALAFIGALGLVGCGAPAAVSFGKYSGENEGQKYTIAATTWDKLDLNKEENKTTYKDFDAVYELVTSDTKKVAYNSEAREILGYGEDVNNFVAIKFLAQKVKKFDQTKVTIKIDGVDKTSAFFDDKYDFDGFTLVKGLKEGTEDFTVEIDWDKTDDETETKSTTFKYKFLVTGAKLAEAPAAE